MKVTIKTTKEVNLVNLIVDAGVRYWEDATVNGIEDTNGDLIPCRVGDRWMPTIRIDTGTILSWPKGITASIHYKVCDDGSYHLIDDEYNTVLSIENDYVPRIMCPKETGYGDYIIMDIDENGKIKDWKVDIEDFQDDYNSY